MSNVWCYDFPRLPDNFNTHAVKEYAGMKVSGGLEVFRANKQNHYAKQGTFFFLHGQQAL